MNTSAEEYARYKYVIENIKDIIWQMDTNMIFTYVSPTAKESIGYEPDELIGKSILDIVTTESKMELLYYWKKRLESRINGKYDKVILYDVQIESKEGKIIWHEVSVKPVFEDQSFLGYIGTSRDISEKKALDNKITKYIKELKEKNSKLDELATLDMLTGAYNRRKFEYYVKECIEKNEKYGSPFSITIFDIDHFKRINDSYGHKKGDQILQEISAIVKRALRDTDRLFRWGGDEFIILLPDITLKNAYKVAKKVRSTIEKYDFGIQSKEVTVSLGLGEYKIGENLDQFVSRADTVLLEAKANGRNKIVLS